MNALYITSKPAYPKVDGGCVASANFLNNLSKVVSSVKYLTIETGKHAFDLSAFPADLAQTVKPESVFIETGVRPMEAFKFLFNDKSYNIDRFYSEAFKNKIAETIAAGSFDCIILDSLFTTPYLDAIRQVFNGKVIVRAHNVEFSIWQGLAKNEKNPIKKKYLKGLAKDLKKYEIETLNKVDGIMPLSQDDLNAFNDLEISTPKAMITITANIQEKDHDYSSQQLFHLGAMNWQPNVEAVNNVVELLPQIRSKNENLEFHIAGIESDSLYSTDSSKGIIVDGYVKDLNTFVSKMGILISPIVSGSGIRVKILEMMAYGIPVITTELGAQGLLDTKGVCIANTDHEIVQAVYELTSDENKRRMLGVEAKSYVNLHHNPEKVSEQIIEFIKSI